MNTNELLEKAKKTLEDVKTKYEEDKKKLEELKNERGVLQASKIVDVGEFKDEEKIKTLDKTIDKLKVEIDSAGTPLISALKAKILSLKAKKEREEKEKAEKEQDILEEKLNKNSKKLLSKLKEAYEANKILQKDWATFRGLAAISGRALTNMKASQGSVGMLNLLYLTLSREWDGVSRLEVRQFYSKQHFKTRGVIF